MFALEMRLLGYWTSSVACLKSGCAHQSSAYLTLIVRLTNRSGGQAEESLGMELKVWAPRGWGAVGSPVAIYGNLLVFHFAQVPY